MRPGWRATRLPAEPAHLTQRRNFLIDRGFQPRFAMELAAIVLLVPVGVWINYFIVGQYLLFDEGVVSNQTSFWQMVQALLTVHWGWVAILYVVSFLLVSWCIVLYAHRVAGPLYRLELFLVALREGDLTHRMHTRRQDYFDDVARRANDVGVKLQHEVEFLKDAVATLARRASQPGGEAIRAEVETLQHLLSQLNIRS